MKEGRTEPIKGGDEYDALTHARKYYHFCAGTLKRIKRQYNKRVRQSGKKEIKGEIQE
tara:strand:- start:709 stop:882 length:174 start_codon:yes stop_codon:yes gene_type:complete